MSNNPCPLCGRDMTVIETYAGRGELSSGRVPLYYCKGTNKSIFMGREVRLCQFCGTRIMEEIVK